MTLDTISPNKRLTKVKGAGVQFLPGYPEPFNKTIRRFLSSQHKELSLIELAGGGLSFLSSVITLPNLSNVICNDLDISALNYQEICQHFSLGNSVERSFRDKAIFVGGSWDRCLSVLDSKKKPDVIIALRLCHFFSPETFHKFLALTSSRLNRGGHLIVSAFSKEDFDDPTKVSEFYSSSTPIGRKSYYRRFKSKDPTAKRLRKDQNLQEKILILEPEYLAREARRVGLRVVHGPERATRIVHGFILKKIR